MDLDAVTGRESVPATLVLPSVEAESLIVRQRQCKIPYRKDRCHSPYGCHEIKRYRSPEVGNRAPQAIGPYERPARVELARRTRWRRERIAGNLNGFRIQVGDAMHSTTVRCWRSSM